MSTPIRSIVDAHAHFYDGNANVHDFLNQRDAVYEALVGHYETLPRRYLPDDYLADTTGYNVAGVVWHEYLSNDTLKEARWAQHLADTSALPQAMVALVDFLDPRLDERLEAYKALPNVAAVREHLGWDTSHPLRRLAKQPNLLTNATWLKGLARLHHHDFKCGLEVFAPQLPDLLSVVRQHPNLSFTFAVLGWPLDLGGDGFAKWRKDVNALSQCDNVVVGVSAIECIFGMDWNEAQIRPWLLTLIESFTPSRCMFGSHLPISNLSRNFQSVYGTYERIVRDFSASDQQQMFHDVAANWFRLQTKIEKM